MFHETTLNSVLDKIVARWGIPGLAVGIVQDDEIVYARGFGVQSLNTRAPVTPDSIFCVASVSKVFVATAVMQLAERGCLDLDAPVVTYLPYFRMADERYTRVTIRHMLSHTSGMPDMDEFEYLDLLEHPERDDAAAERYVRGLSSRKLVAEPGSEFHYSNIAYNVLGDVIAKAGGVPFEAYLREHVLAPAGMPGSSFLLADVPHARLAVPHLRAPGMVVNPIYPYHRADAPASFLHSTVRDMCAWAITCLNRGIVEGQSILTPAGYELMWSPVAQWGYPPLYEEVGLGWTLGHVDGVRTVSHGGMGFGWTDFLALLPERRQGAVILCNEESFARERVVQAVIDVMLGRRPQTGAVSWMAPISQALSRGGIAAAQACYADLKEGGLQDYIFDDGELLSLVPQLMMAKKPGLAMDVLRLNIRAFPGSVASWTYLAALHLRQGQLGQAEECALRALSIQPGHAGASHLLDSIQARLTARAG